MHHLVKKILLPAKFHFNPHCGNFYNILFFSFKKDLNGQNHSSSDSNHHIKNSPPSKIPHLPNGQISQGFPEVLRTWGDLNRYMGRIAGWGVGGGDKMLLRNICEGVLMLVKLSAIRLQACKFTKNELLHTYFSRI